jgi:hypothetical protein
MAALGLEDIAYQYTLFYISELWLSQCHVCNHEKHHVFS